MTPTPRVRRLDELVETLWYTGGNADAVLALVGGVFRAESGDDRRLTLIRAAARDRDVDDGERVCAVKAYESGCHCRAVPIE